MFGSLKKKLQNAIAKVTGKIEAEEKPVSAPTISEPLVKEPAEEAKFVEKEEERAEQAFEAEETKHELEELPPKLEEAEEELIEKEERVEPEVIIKKEELVLSAAVEKTEKHVAKDVEEEVKIEQKPQKLGLFKRITEKTLTEDEIETIMKELELALLENDVAVEVAGRIGADLKIALLGRAVKRGKTEDVIKEALRDAMLDVLGQEQIDLDERIRKKEGTFLIAVVGFNGAGKTTTCARLAYKLKHFKPILAAGDTFRAASIEQLEEHGRRLGVEVIKHRYGADSAAVIFDARKHAEAIKSKLVLADTAGRSHANTNLMEELAKVMRVNKPDLKVLVLDALTGNDIYDQANMFDKTVGIDAIILTKADVYEKGGAALSAAYALKKPILYLGVGQGYDDLRRFDPKEIVENLLG